MELMTTNVLKYLALVFILCHGVLSQCSKKAIVDKTKTPSVTFHSLPIRDTKTNLSQKYDSKGLGPLFDLANSFMDTVQPKNIGDVFTKEVIKEKKYEDWKWVITKYELPIAICVGIGLLFIIFMPIVGFCFCCCRCCGKCGGDMKQSEKKSSQHCKAAFMVFLLFVFSIMMLCGTLFMFVTNNSMKDGYDAILPTTNDAIDEVIKMGDNARLDITDLANDQAFCVTGLLRDSISEVSIRKEIGDPLRDKVNQNVSAVLTLGETMSTKINTIVTRLEHVVEKNRTFFQKIDEFYGELDTIQSDLKNAVDECRKNATLSSICDDLGKVKVEDQMKVDDLPNIAAHIQDMKDVQKLKLSDNIKKANRTINDIPKTVVDKSKSALNEVRTFLNDTEKEISSEGKKVNDEIKKITDDIRDDMDKQESYKAFKDGEYDSYERIRWKVYIALSALMAFIVFILLCGLTCGSCGYNKEYMPTERTPVSNCGGNCLMAAVGLMFIFSFILMIFCVLWFAVGIHVHIACREMKDGRLVDSVLDIVYHDKENKRPNISAQSILQNCQNNVALYQSTPYIEEKFNVTEKIKMDQMKEIKEKINSKVKIDLSGEKILTDDAKKALEDLINSEISNIDFTKYYDILNDDLTKQDLNAVISNLTKIYDELKSKSPAVASHVKKVIDGIKTLNNSTVKTLRGNIVDLNNSAISLQNVLSGIKTDGEGLLNKLKAAEKFVQDDTAPYITEKVKGFADELFNYATEGINHLINEIQTNAARCKPIYNVYKGVVGTFMCDNLLQNINGFWLALGWCLLFFIPSIILSVKLAKYFRKMEYTAGMDTIVVDHPPYNDKLPPIHDMRAPPPYTSTQHNNPGYQHV